MSKYTMLLLCWILTLPLSGQDKVEAEMWVDSIMLNMSLDEKIGQLFMLRAHSDKDEEHTIELIEQILEFKPGGLCFFQGTPQKQAELTNIFQANSKVPLMISMDAEWGLGMRHKSAAISFPKQLTLGAIYDNTLIYDMGQAIAEQLQSIGVHVNFAPVADINNNPLNPVIHDRSFGEDQFNVATKSYAYTKGLQDAGIMACAKHFPGHGDTDTDSHYDLPVIMHDEKRLDSLEMMPFRVLSQLGVQSMMMAHMSIPALDDRPHRPSSLSKAVVTDLLKNKIHFEGLIFTDALEMKGVTKHFDTGEIEIEAIKAGNDILLLPLDLAKAIKKIKEEITTGRLGESVVEQKVRRILSAKYNMGLDQYNAVAQYKNLDSLVNAKRFVALKSKLYEKAITLVQDIPSNVPIEDFQNTDTYSISLGSDGLSPFQNMLTNFGISQHFNAPLQFSKVKKDALIQSVSSAQTVIISLHGLSKIQANKYNLTTEVFDLIFELNSKKAVILVNFGTPYALQYFPAVESIVQSYEDDPLMQTATAQSIMGVHAFEGKLPVTVHPRFPVKTGIYRPSLNRLGYAFPEEVGISSDSLLAIDTIMEEMIRLKASPGCQILAVKDGKIFYDRTFGYHTYEKNNPVQKDDLYDVASVTKTLATTIALMKMHDNNDLNIHKPLKYYIDGIDSTNKADLVIEDILAHHSGLTGWIPFYKETISSLDNSTTLLPKYYRTMPTDSFCVKISEDLYMRNDYIDSMFQKIYTSELDENQMYKYSDLGYYFFKRIIENKNKMPLDAYVEEYFYRPLGLKNTMFNPLQKVDSKRVVPTEEDDYYRCQVIHGHVHDMGAAMMGGVCGHAGLFSNAGDLAVLMQMLLNGGSYGGKKFLAPGTVHKFTQRYYRSSRRGLGFDMKELDENKILNIAQEASDQTFGHLGFTGISVYADPKYDLIYIFLSNRTYPTMKNTIFSRNNYRPRVQSVFYKAMADYREDVHQ